MMNRPLLKKTLTQTLAWAGLVVLCGVAAIAQNETPAAGQRTDGQIEMDVVGALENAGALKGDLITAATIQSEVTLSGTVSSANSRKLAESIASHVAGVTAVHDNLKVGNPQAAPSAARQSADGQPDDSGYPDSSSGDYQPAPPETVAPSPLPYQPGAQAQPQGNNSPPQYPPVPPPPAQQAFMAPVALSQGTLLQLRTSEPVDSKRARDGEPVQFIVIRDVTVGGVLAIPRGATVHGVVTEVKKAGRLAGKPELALALTALDLGGKRYPLETDQFKVKGPGKGGRTFGHALGGAFMGAMIGGLADGGPGAAIGAVAGAGAGTAASAVTPGAALWIPAEALVEFHLLEPLTVTPVSAQEAARLAQGLYSGGPNLYRRRYSPYYGQYPYAYDYPPVYYHPFYLSGGYYYWR